MSNQYFDIPPLGGKGTGGGAGSGGITSINGDTTAAQTINAGLNIQPITTAAGATTIATSGSPLWTNETVSQQFLCNGAITSTSAIVGFGWDGSSNNFQGYQFGGNQITFPNQTGFTCHSSRFSWFVNNTVLAQLDNSKSQFWVNSAGQPGQPTFTFTGDIASGLYQRATGQAALVAGGSEVLRVDSGNNTSLAMLGNSLAVTATCGFVYLPAASGTPNGVPATTYNGGIPVIISSSTNSLYLYNNGWQSVSGGGSGTVTSIALATSSPSIFNVSGSPITTNGTFTLQETIQSSGVIFAGPATGTQSSAPTFRQLVSTDIPSLSATYLPLAGGTMSGNISMGSSSQIVNMIDPINAQDGATKAYVDAVAAGLSVYGGVEAASTATMNATYLNGVSGIGATLTNAGSLVAFNIDGYSPTLGQKVLIKNQSNNFQNGIYSVTTIGSGAVAWVLTRATDYNQAPAEIFPGNLVFSSSGIINASTQWVETAIVNTIGTDPILFNQFNVAVNTVGTFSGSSQVNGASISGNTITFGPADTTNPGMIKASGAQTLGASLVIANSISTSGISNGGQISSIGNADQNQLYIRGNSTQTTNVVQIQKSDNTTNLLTLNNSGSLSVALNYVGVGATLSGVLKSSGQQQAVVSTSANLVMTTIMESIIADATSGNITVTLPAASNKNRTRVIKKDGTSNLVTVLNTGSDTIEGASSSILNNQYDGLVLIGDGISTNYIAETVIQGAPGGFGVATVTSNINLRTGNIYLVDSTSARSMTLPAPQKNYQFYIKDKSGQANANNFTVQQFASEQIEGTSASKVLQTNWGSWFFVCDGTNWFIL